MDGIDILRQGAGLRRRPELYTLRLTGPDRVRYLNGMVTNDVAALAPGQAQRAVKANNKGKVEGTLRIRATEDAFLIDVLEVVANRVAGALIGLLVMDDAELSDATDDRVVLALDGPRAAEVLGAAGYGVGDLAHLAAATTGTVTIVRDDRLGVPGFELHVPTAEADAVEQSLLGAGAQAVDAAAVEVLRVEAGVPEDGVDVDDDTIPLEARLDEALSFTKGCYVGQETIARAHNLGGVKHRLVGFEIDGAKPPAGAEVFADGVDKAAGEITSVVRSPNVGGLIALGYVRVAHEAPGTALRITWEGGEATAKVSNLPFVAPAG